MLMKVGEQKKKVCMFKKKRQQEIGVSGPLVEKGKDQISLLWQCVGIWVVKEDENPQATDPL